ncbi:IPT/TIG domain-containing protein [Gelidibacter japonicus]|uniref:IPT/TIG domain-containing protein n=1 Tax=Gelidibacter japonicus TaxID=1962232 RepID=UPI002AFDFE75|nr:IPT/TIG domain-containing protein [Gelidibacter japonicus]
MKKLIKFNKYLIKRGNVKRAVLKIAVILLLINTTLSCDKEDDISAVPTISSISPEFGPKNSVVTINGDNFGTDANKVKVFFNEVEATIQSVTNTQITAIVPPRSFSGFVKVVINEKSLMGPEFIYQFSDYQVTTFAGSTQGFADGPGTTAKFDNPKGLAMDAQGNLYVVDENNQKIRKITPDGMVSTLSGSTLGFADGPGATAQFYDPIGIAVDGQGNVYVGDSNNNRIRKIAPNGLTSTLAGSTYGFADGVGAVAKFNAPYGVAVDDQGNVFVADLYNHKIRKVTSNGVVSTLAGSAKGFADGMGIAAQFNFPSGITVDNRGNVYISDSNNHKIRKVTSSGVVSTLAGSIAGFKDGEAEIAQFDFPNEMAVDASGRVYVTDGNNHKIRKIELNGAVSTIAGSISGFADGTTESALFNSPYGVVINTEGVLYVVDNNNNRIRKMIPE